MNAQTGSWISQRMATKMVRNLAGNVAIEMGIAGGQILREEFGFEEDQIKRWIDLTLERAKKNRGENVGE